MKKRTENSAPTWPEELALACPECERAYPLAGVRPDLGLIFQCPTHRWFSADSWTTRPELVNTHEVEPRYTDPALREEFIAGAISVLLRAGGDADHLILQSAVPDNSVQFVVFSDGDGSVVAQASSRRHPCNRCRPRPLESAQEEVLYRLGFGPISGGENYVVAGLPADPVRLTAAADVVFHQAFQEAEGLSLWALFSRPALAEAFYLGWSFRAQT